MIGWILHAAHRQPTVMNGAVMKNFVTPDAPFASALVGDPELFVSEVDESDGSIALYRPEIAVLTNVSLDHKEMEELRRLFAGFLLSARKAVLNLDDPETRALAEAVPEKTVSYGFDAPRADFRGRDLQLLPNGLTFVLHAEGEKFDVRLSVPGRHNASNALVGEAGGVTVIDDFAHNPDKIDATLATLRAQPGRLLIMFQPHGYGPLTKMGEELATSLAKGMAEGDQLYLPDPVYQGGTVEKARGSDWLVEQVSSRGRAAKHIAERARIGDALVEEAKTSDRILVMGARDDTLIDFANDLVERLARRN
jgi:UDP-N-acetylmuramate--alanine ligase